MLNERFKCFMVYRGEVELTLKRAKEMVSKEKLGAEYIIFIRDQMEKALTVGVTIRRPDGSITIIDQNGFDDFLQL